MRTTATSAATWAQLVRVRSRYHRSVHLERDSGEDSWLDGYIVTPLVCSTLARIAEGLHPDHKERAWSLTGPYGSGKSAFALFLSKLLRTPETGPTNHARRALAKVNAAREADLFGATGPLKKREGLLPVLATGERAGLDAILLKALRDAVVRHWSGRGGKPLIFQRVLTMADRVAAGKSASSREVVELFEAVAEKLGEKESPTRGLLVVLDEAGKALEFASQHPTRSDIQLLQELAELAARSGDAPIVFVVSLHQAFESYASRLSASQRNEWAKVQGRFADVAFQEASDQVLGLIGAALEPREPLPKAIEAVARTRIAAVVASLRIASAAERERVACLLQAPLPLHPATALCLAPLFRARLAQNERSLFAFLSSSEPCGFQEFLARPGLLATEEPFLTVDRLYDYAVAALGGGTLGHQGRTWLQIQESLKRLPGDADELDVRVIKVVGLLAALGETSGLFASEEFLAAALTNCTADGRKALAASLARLRDASILVYRKYKDAHQLWEGSDIDLDALLEATTRQLDPTATVVRQLGRTVAPRPIVARRHLFETGTLRYFEVRYADETLLATTRPQETVTADGVVWLLVPSSQDAARDVRTKLALGALRPERAEVHSKPLLVAVPEDTGRLRDLALEATGLEKIRAEAAQLQSDPVARRELDERIAEVKRLIGIEVTGVVSGGRATTWYTPSGATRIKDARALASLVSQICDDAYRKAPQVFNELINRNELSSAAAAARRELMQAMIERPAQEDLGIEGFPPEKSMYLSVLKEHGLHRKRDGAWALGPAPARREGGLHAAMGAIEVLLEANDSKRVAMPAAYEALRAPPFGVKDGLIPVLVLAELLHRQEELALYEDGTFVPTLTAPHVERWLRNPEKFELQMTRIQGARSRLLEAMVGPDDGRARLLPLVRQLLKLVQGLAAYSRNTKSISLKAQAVREALLRAKEPAPLVFQALPEALGQGAVSTFEEKPGAAAALGNELKECLRELSKAYPELLNMVEREVLKALGVANTPPEEAREHLRAWSTALAPKCGDVALKGFLIRIGDDALAREEWLVSVATFLGGKPPEGWYDSDVEHMRQNLAMLARRFKAALTVNLADNAPKGAALVRLAIAQTDRDEVERLIILRPEDEENAARFAGQLRDLVEANAADTSRETLLAALALLARDMSTQLGDSALHQGEA